jgi:phosphatidylglycerol---prolipoprotein diacylglyceryl transferase
MSARRRSQIVFPEIDPVLFSVFEVGGVEIALRWYAISPISAGLVGWQIVARRSAAPALWGGARARPAEGKYRRSADLDGRRRDRSAGGSATCSSTSRATMLANPAEIPAIWRGGMSFHGGFVG